MGIVDIFCATLREEFVSFCPGTDRVMMSCPGTAQDGVPVGIMQDDVMQWG